jgi:putative component of membrane protein insertase Oxa1/YidC/SpoIIIJ protein YidD
MTFTTKNGSKYTIESTSTRTLTNGKQITTSRVNVYNPATGHGWNGIMSQDEIAQWRAA